MDNQSEQLVMLSIVLVCLNNLNDVKKTVESLGNLGYPEKQLVVIDSSSDSSILAFLRGKNSQFEIIYEWQSPKGVYAAMNLGIQKSKDNSLIWFLNPGDTLVNEIVVHELINSIIDDKNAWGFAQARNAHPLQSEIYPTIANEVSSKLIVSGMLTISHQAVFARKSILTKLHLFNEKFKIASDVEMILKLSNYKHTFVEEVLVEIDQTGLSNKYPVRTLFESISIFRNFGLWSRKYAYYKLIKNLITLLFGILRRDFVDKKQSTITYMSLIIMELKSCIFFFS
jgi:glycosyltransferase involved in cell wall biosynthesis